MSANKYISYLPKDKSEYDAICTKESDYGEDNMKFSEVIGMKAMDSLKYVSYTFINVVGRKDGKAIVENAESKENKENTENTDNSNNEEKTEKTGNTEETKKEICK